MDILLLTRSLDLRGSTVYTLNLASQLAAKGHGVRLFCGGGRLLPEFERAGVPVVVFPGLGDGSDLFLTRKLAKRVREKPAALLHAQTPQSADTAAKVAKAAGVPYFMTVHAPMEGKLATGSRQLRGVFVPSESVRESLVNETRVKKDLIKVVLPGVDVKRLKESPPFAGEKGSPVIGIVGPLEEVRGHDTFLEAAKLILAEVKDAQFLILGEGPEEEKLRRKTQELGIAKNVVFTPDPENYYSTIAQVDVFLMPFQQIGLGNTILEAMACGKPVVASSVGGVYYVIREEETGLLRPRGDAPAFRDAVLALLRDREKARRIGHAARLHVETNFTAERMAAETLEVYQRELETASSHG